MNWKAKIYENYVSSVNTSDVVEDYSSLYIQSKPIAFRVMRYIPSERNINIVDLGCGSGRYLYHLHQKGYKSLEGVDYSKEQVEIAQKSGLNFIIEGDLVDFLEKKPDESIDIILAMDIFEHFTREELFLLLPIIQRKLKKDGKIILHVPNAEGIFGNRVRYGDLTHEIAFTRMSLMQLFKCNGFKEITCYEDKPIIHGIISFFRRVIWDIGTIPFRILYTAETGDPKSILSQNMLVTVQN